MDYKVDSFIIRRWQCIEIHHTKSHPYLWLLMYRKTDRRLERFCLSLSVFAVYYMARFDRNLGTICDVIIVTYDSSGSAYPRVFDEKHVVIEQ